MKYRYIGCGECRPDDPIREFRLIAKGRAGDSSSLIRVHLPDDFEVEPDGGYAITSDKRMVKDFEPVVMIRFNGRLRVSEEMTKLWRQGLQPHQFHIAMEERGYLSICRFGFLTIDQYAFCFKRYEKIYQLKRVPSNLSDFDGFWGEAEYREHKGYADKVRAILDEPEFALIRDMTDEEAVDFYGGLCFSCGSAGFRELSEGYVRQELRDKLFLRKMMMELQ